MNALYERDFEVTNSPLDMWLHRNAVSSLTKFQHLMAMGSSYPLVFQGEVRGKFFKAYIDPENQFAAVDKLSQVK